MTVIATPTRVAEIRARVYQAQTRHMYAYREGGEPPPPFPLKDEEVSLEDVQEVIAAYFDLERRLERTREEKRNLQARYDRLADTIHKAAKELL